MTSADWIIGALSVASLILAFLSMRNVLKTIEVLERTREMDRVVSPEDGSTLVESCSSSAYPYTSSVWGSTTYVPQEWCSTTYGWCSTTCGVPADTKTEAE